MAGTLSTVGRNAAANAVVDLLDAGSPYAYFNFLGSSSTVLAHLHFNATEAFGAASTGVCTMATDPAVSNAETTVAGTAASAAMYASGGTAVITAISVGATANTATQVVMSTTTIGAGDTVTLSSLTVTMPATTT